MTYTITQFGNDTTPRLPDLDQNFKAFGVLAPIPCSASGTNVITLTQNGASQAASTALIAYENYVAVCAVAASNNSTAATAAVGSLAQLPIYKDTAAGPVALVGGEIVANCAFTLIYDSALNSGGGGWHLVASTANPQGTAGATISPTLVKASGGIQVGSTLSPTLTALLSQVATLTYTSIVPGSSQDQSFSMTGLTATDVLAAGLPVPVSTGLNYAAYLGGGATVTVRASNGTAASTITPGTITVNIKALRTV